MRDAAGRLVTTIIYRIHPHYPSIVQDGKHDNNVTRRKEGGARAVGQVRWTECIEI